MVVDVCAAGGGELWGEWGTGRWGRRTLYMAEDMEWGAVMGEGGGRGAERGKRGRRRACVPLRRPLTALIQRTWRGPSEIRSHTAKGDPAGWPFKVVTIGRDRSRSYRRAR